MKICYVPSADAPGFYRCLSPGKELGCHNVDVFMPPQRTEMRQGRETTFFDLDFKLPRSADLYVFQQWRERVLNEDGVKKLRGFGMATAMDVDDNYINIPAYNPAFIGTHPYRSARYGRILNRQERRNLKRSTGFVAPPNSTNYLHMLEAMKQMDLVTVSTPFLAEVYAPYNNNIKVVRNFIDWEMWDDVTPQYEVERKRLRIGYTGTFDYRLDDLKVLQGPIQRILREHPNVDFVAMDRQTHEFLGVPKRQRKTMTREGRYDFYDRERGIVNVPRYTALFDVGVVPLAKNDLNEGKSHLKGMEYNAAGIPFIASPTESYRDYWCSQENGQIAETPGDWYEWMHEYVTDHDFRRTQGYEGRGLARRHSIQQNWREWYDVYAEVVGDEHYATARKAVSIGAVQKVSELGPFLTSVRDLNPQTIVEIGTARGGTFWAIAQTISENALLISMDIPAGSPLDLNRKGEDVYTGRDRDRIKHLIKPTQTLKLIDMNSQLPQALATLQHALEGRQIDLLFIDGDHRYEGVKHDFETYAPLVRPGGMVAFHDIVTHHDKRVGVSRLWSEAKIDSRFKRFQEFIGQETWGYTPWGGIGVLHV